MKIINKDAPYSHTIRTVYNFFQDYNIPLTTTLEKNPLPACWSHTLQSNPYRFLITNGKGECKEASIASSYGEFVERFASGFFFAEYALKKEKFFFHHSEIQITMEKSKKAIRKQKIDKYLLNQELLQFYDPDCQLYEKHLLDNNYDENDRGIILTPFHSLFSFLDKKSEITYFPIALLNNIYVSNGMAAGNSRFECLSQALSEIFERYVKFMIIREGIALPNIPRHLIEQFTDIAEKIKTLENNNYQVQIKDASLGGQFPVICTLLLCPDGGAFASFGCSCHLYIAIARSITEMLQGRNISKLEGFEPPTFTVERYANVENMESHFINSEGDLPWQLFSEARNKTFDGTAWNFSGNSKKEFYHLRDIVKKNNFLAYIQEYNQFPLHACRIIVPGMSEIYPIDDLILNNRNQGSWLRPLLLQLPTMKSKKLQQFLKKLEESALPVESYVSYLIGIPFAEDSPWATLQLGELRAMVALSILSQKEEKMEDYDVIYDALQWCEWTKEYGNEEKKSIYHLLTILLSIAIEGETKAQYQKALQYSFSVEENRIATDILSGDISFWGLPFANSWEKLSKEYASVIKAYNIFQDMSCLQS